MSRRGMFVRATAALATLGAGVLLLLLHAVPAHADEFARNAWGLFAGPTTYELVSGSEYDRATSSTSLDWGVFYTRFVTRKFSVRVEARVAGRHIDMVERTYAMPASQLDGVSVTRIDEHILEIPILIQGDRRASVGGVDLRLSTGIGICYEVLIDQHLMNFTERSEAREGFGGYQNLSLLFDAGGALDVAPGDAFFLRFRVAYDTYTIASTDDVGEVTEYFSFGFYAGFESTF